MRERERERVRQLELQDQEREAMLRQNHEMKEEEIRQVMAKKDAGKKLLEEVAASNAEQIELKRREKDKEVDEERRIAEVNEKKYNQRVKDREVATRKKEKEVSRMERVEMQLIQKLKNTQQLQQQAFQELENALNGEV